MWLLGAVVDVNVAGHIAAFIKVAFEIGVACHIAADIGRALKAFWCIVLYWQDSRRPAIALWDPLLMLSCCR